MAITVLIVFKALPALCSLRGLVLILLPVKMFQCACFHIMDKSLKAVPEPEIKELLMKHFSSGVMRVWLPMLLLQAFLGTLPGYYLFVIIHFLMTACLTGLLILSMIIICTITL